MQLGAEGEEDPLLLLLAWKLNCGFIMEVTMSEWMLGWTINKCFNIDDMNRESQTWKHQVAENQELYYMYYNYTFNYLKEEKATALPKEQALLAWKMTGVEDRWVLFPKWKQFWESGNANVTSDTWRMLLRFIDIIGDDIGKYDENDYWPTAFDDFIEYAKRH